ncbi:hypothetical protein PIROE2DRAFT_13676 [Piromyces sp. E2]|nr:hypothetical protein PIROE2DRAFT_13676 [Piromyces sp. E2]|eukprot:OUM60524.1 hypothetical protein PIROE2DRAFT_13676 [Piromyces sp. E2]
MFKFGSGGDVKVDPTLDSLFKNSVPVPPKASVPVETQQPKEEKVEKVEKKKNKKAEKKENKKKEGKKEQPVTPTETKKETKKRKRDEEDDTKVEEKKEKTEKELIEEQYRKQFQHEALKTEKAKKKNKEKKEKEKKKEEEEEEEVKPKKKRKVRDEPEKLERTLFVGNLDKNVTEKAFSKNLPKKIAFITKEFHPERDCLNAYIVFEDKESAEKALELNGSLFNDKHMRVDLERKEKVLLLLLKNIKK